MYPAGDKNGDELDLELEQLTRETLAGFIYINRYQR